MTRVTQNHAESCIVSSCIVSHSPFRTPSSLAPSDGEMRTQALPRLAHLDHIYRVTVLQMWLAGKSLEIGFLGVGKIIRPCSVEIFWRLQRHPVRVQGEGEADHEHCKQTVLDHLRAAQALVLIGRSRGVALTRESYGDSQCWEGEGGKRGGGTSETMDIVWQLSIRSCLSSCARYCGSRLSSHMNVKSYPSIVHSGGQTKVPFLRSPFGAAGS